MIEIARIFGEKADFGDIVEKTLGDLLENTVNDENQLTDTIEGREWNNQLEAASVAKRVQKKIGGEWTYAIKPVTALARLVGDQVPNGVRRYRRHCR